MFQIYQYYTINNHDSNHKWKLEAGGWKLEVRGWRLKNNKPQTTNPKQMNLSTNN